MHVEFLGIPRHRAGIAQTEMRAETLGQLLEMLASEIPSLRELIAGDRLQAGREV